jgi:PAS domain S-box-containing protein
MKKKQRNSQAQEIQQLLNYSNRIMATFREPFLILDKNLKVISANQAFYDRFKVAEKETIGTELFDLGNKQWNIPQLLKLLKKVIPNKKVVKDYQVEHQFETIGQRTMILNASQVHMPKKIGEILNNVIKKAVEAKQELILLDIEDVTERIRQERELSESEERYRRAFETSRDGLLLVSKKDGSILNSNDAARNLLGYSKKQFLKKKLYQIGITKDAKDFYQVAAKLEKDALVYYEDLPVHAYKNHKIITEVFLVDRAKVLQCNIRDITARKKMKSDLLRLKELQFKTLLENITGKVFFKDRNAHYIICNENYAEDLNIKPEEIIGKTDRDFFSKKVADKYRRDDKRIMGLKIPENIEEEQVIKNETRFINTIKMPVLDSEGNVIGLLGIIGDITEQKKKEKELDNYRYHLEELLQQKKKEIEETEARFRTVFEDSNDGILIADPKTKKFYMSNKAMQKMLGYTADELNHLSVYDIHPEESLPRIIDIFEKQARGEMKIGPDFPIKRKDGKVLYVDVIASVITLDGKKYLKGSFRDVTERKKANDALLKAAKIKTEFTSMVSHELRTPLAAIKEGISVVLDKIAGELNEEQVKYLSISKNNAERMDRLIGAVLDFQKLEAGKQEYKMEKHDLNEAFLTIQKSMTLLAEKKGLTLKIELCKNLPDIRFDKEKIIQVLINLISNAIKFTEKGSITVKAAKLDHRIKVMVKDTGIGIKKNDIPKLFQEFKQLKRKAGGTGLGLFISKKIIDAHKGKIWADSELGKGSTFWFTLPLKSGE